MAKLDLMELKRNYVLLVEDEAALPDKDDEDNAGAIDKDSDGAINKDNDGAIDEDNAGAINKDSDGAIDKDNAGAIDKDSDGAVDKGDTEQVEDKEVIDDKKDGVAKGELVLATYSRS